VTPPSPAPAQATRPLEEVRGKTLLRQSEERFRALVESVKDYAIFMLDREGHVQTWNAGAQLIKGYTPTEILGRSLATFYTPEDRERGKPAALLAKAVELGRIEDEGWRVRKDGSTFWADVVITAMRNETGELIGFAKVTRDLSQRRRTEEERLRRLRADDKFRVVVESVRDYAIFMLDTDGRVRTWNVGAELIKGYRPDEIIGRSIETFYTPEDRLQRKPARLLAQALREGRIENEGWRVRKDGTRFWADVIITALYGQNGDHIGFAKVTRDSTARWQADEELRRSEERFRLLVDSVEDYAIFMLNPEGYVTTWNIGAERIKGFKAEEILGKHFSCFWPADDVAAGRCEQELERAKLDGRVEQEGWRLRKNGTRFWANVVISAVRDACGQLVGFAKVTRDLTARRNLEQERLQRARAEEALRVRDEFLSIASHELKTPLTSVQMEMFALKDRLQALDERAERKFERLSRNVDRLSALVDALLDVSRIATGRLALNPEPLELGEVVTGMVENMRLPAERAGCNVSVAVEESLAGCWDRLRIEQVLVNLLSNAFKYAAGSPVAVRLTREGDDTAVITVRDRGPGIPEEDLPRVFDRFARAAPLQNYGGLGLGLYVSRQIATAHGGTITARNRSGGGTEFVVHLPLATTLRELP
jgi:PAS domain S-box-containing protein